MVKKLINFFFQDKVVIIFIFLLSFLVGIYRNSEIPIYPDEITWMVRAKETALAIRTLNFGFFDSAWWTIKNDTESIALPLTVSVGFPIIYLGKGQSVLSYNLFQDYVIGRAVVVFLTSTFFGAFYYFASKIFNRKVALFSLVLLMLDSVFVANSRIIMNDIFLTVFLFLSICFYLFIKNKPLSILLTSFAVAASFITKPHGLLVLPVLFLTLIDQKIKFKYEFSKHASIVILTFVIISLLWPASWTAPLSAIPEYILRQKELAGSGISLYFFGRVTSNPPFYYYLFQLLTRIPTIVLFSFLSYLFISLKKDLKVDFKSHFVIFSFLILFSIFISFSPKKLGARYILPLWPWLYLYSGKVLLDISSRFKGQVVKLLTVSVVIFFSFRTYFIFFPNNYLYYNSLVGGVRGASRYGVVGLCSGSKPAVQFLGKCYPKVERIAVLGCGKTTIPYYWPHKFTRNWKEESVVVIENHFLQLERDSEVVKFYRNNNPTHTINVAGADLAHIYTKEGVDNICDD
jgi:hypothetical protein